MALLDFSPGADMQSSQVRQIIRLINGDSGYGAPLQLTALSDPLNYVLNLKNNDSGSKLINGLASDGSTVLLRVDGSGVRFSPDGVTGNLTPASTSGTEALTNKVVTYRQGDAITAAATILVPNSSSGGNAFVVNGTTPITAIGATAAGHVVRLLFAATGCKVQAGALLLLNGDFWSIANATLTLYCDGTHWIELARTGDATVGCSLYLNANQLINTNTDTEISWEATKWVYGGVWAASPTPKRIYPGAAGKYLVCASAIWAASNAGNRQAWVAVNGGKVQRLSIRSPANAGEGWSNSAIVPLASSGDYLSILVNQDSGSGLYLTSGSTETAVQVTRLGP